MRLNLIPSEFQKQMIDNRAARRAAKNLVQIGPYIGSAVDVVHCISMGLYQQCQVSLQITESPQDFETIKERLRWNLDQFAKEHGAIEHDKRHGYVQRYAYPDDEPVNRARNQRMAKRGMRDYITIARYWFRADCQDPKLLELKIGHK